MRRKGKKPHKKNTALIFETIFTRKLNYITKWFIIAFIGFCVSQVVIQIYDQKQYFICRLIFTGTIWLWPILYVKVFNDFNSFIENIGPTFWKNQEDCLSWMGKKVTPSLFLKTKFSLFLYIATSLSIIMMVIRLGLPFTVTQANLFALLGFLMVSLVSSYGLTLLITILYTLFSLSGMENNIEIFSYKPLVVSKIKKYCCGLGTLSFEVYSIILVGTFYSPYKFNNIALNIYMLILSVFPLSFYIIAVIFSKRVIRRSKQREMNRLDAIIKEYYDEIMSNPNKKSIENYKMVINYKEYLLSYKPVRSDIFFEFSKYTLGLIITIIPPLIQLIISLSSTAKSFLF